MKQNEYTANQALAYSAHIVRHATQRKAVAKKQHNGLWFCVMLSASALIGALLAY